MIESGDGGGGGGGCVAGPWVLTQSEPEQPACAAEWIVPSLTQAGHLTPDQVSAAGGGCQVSAVCVAVCVASRLAEKDVGGVYSYRVWAGPADGEEGAAFDVY